MSVGRLGLSRTWSRMDEVQARSRENVPELFGRSYRCRAAIYTLGLGSMFFQSKIRYLTRRDQCNSDATLTAVNLSRLMSRRIYEQAPIMVGPEMCTQCLGGPVSTHSPPSRPWNTIKATLPGFKPGIRMLMETVNWSSRTSSDWDLTRRALPPSHFRDRFARFRHLRQFPSVFVFHSWDGIS